MSPLTLRRFRAERLLRTDFQRLRGTVLAATRARLRARGVELAGSDLEACYSLAWHGLYAAKLADEQIESPAAWLTLVTFRRALDEHRARRHLVAVGDGDASDGSATAPGLQARRDLAAELDDRARLAALFEGIREQLGPRERQAAVLCYLQGLSRGEAARAMGLTQPRMRKLMDGRGDGRPGVAAKIGALAETIEAGAWCEQRGSLMRALAFGILEPGGERHGIALEHHRSCSACRAYVLSLRGLAALLPPPLLPPALLAAVAGAGGSAAAGGGAAGGGAAAGAGASGGSSGLAAAGAAGGAGGGWALAGGPLGAKLAIGCLLLIGTGCATFGAGVGAGGHARRAAPRRHRAPAARNPSLAAAVANIAAGAGEGAPRGPSATGGPGAGAAVVSASVAAAREFGLSGAAAAAGTGLGASPGSAGGATGAARSGGGSGTGGEAAARAASGFAVPASGAARRQGAPVPGGGPARGRTSAAPAVAPSSPATAAREFGPG